VADNVNPTIAEGWGGCGW